LCSELDGDDPRVVRVAGPFIVIDQPSLGADSSRFRGGPSRSAGYQWAELMRRTFGFDVLACARCGGRLRLVALIDHAATVQRILRHLGLPTEVPEPRPARAPPRRLDTLEDQSRYAPEFDAAW
jgi:hypothetical protein